MNGWANWYGNRSYPSTHVCSQGRHRLIGPHQWHVSVLEWKGHSKVHLREPVDIINWASSMLDKVHCHVLEAIIDETNFIKIIFRNNLTKILSREAILTNLKVYSIYYDFFLGKGYFNNLLSRNAFLSSSTCLLHTWAFQTYRKYNMGPAHVSIDDVC